MIDLRAFFEMIGTAPAAICRDWLDGFLGVGAMRQFQGASLPSPLMSYEEAQAEIDAAGGVEAAIDRRREAAIARRQGMVAVVPIRGVIMPRRNIFELIGLGTSVQSIVAMTRAAQADPDVKAVVQAYDSPGGSSAGVPEGFDSLMALRGDKPIVAVAEHLMASAAYWLASAADEIVAAPSALVGSIGVFSLHMDFSKMLEDVGVRPTFIHAGKYKVDGNMYEPLTDTAREEIQAMVDDVYGQFIDAVAKGRGVTPAVARGEGFGEGRVRTAKAALAAGLTDKTRTLEQTLQAYGIQTEPAPARERASALARREREVQNFERDIASA